MLAPNYSIQVWLVENILEVMKNKLVRSMRSDTNHTHTPVCLRVMDVAAKRGGTQSERLEGAFGSVTGTPCFGRCRFAETSQNKDNL